MSLTSAQGQEKRHGQVRPAPGRRGAGQQRGLWPIAGVQDGCHGYGGLPRSGSVDRGLDGVLLRMPVEARATGRHSADPCNNSPTLSPEALARHQEDSAPPGAVGISAHRHGRPAIITPGSDFAESTGAVLWISNYAGGSSGILVRRARDRCSRSSHQNARPPHTTRPKTTAFVCVHSRGESEADVRP